MDKHRILIIDDDAGLRKTLSDILSAKGYETLAAKDGTEGLSVLKQETINLALIDLQLPDIPGLEVLDRVKSDYPLMEAIILTGHAALESAIEATNKGAFSYLQKPYEIDQLLVHIKRAIEKQQAEEMLREREERFRRIFEDGPIGMIISSPDDRILKANKTICEMLGHTEQELTGRSIEDITHPEDAEKSVILSKQMLKGKIPRFKLEKRYVKKNGEVLWANHTATAIQSQDGKVLYGLGMIEDITERKILDEKLRHAAFHDTLTNLPNRALFIENLKGSLARSERHKDYLFAVLFLDLDRFKNINDSLGHVSGDKLLLEVAERLKKCVRPYDIIARLGGDEFAILLADIKSGRDAIRIAERIQYEINLPFKLNNHEVRTTASIGIVLSKLGYEQPEPLLRDADTAMYQAKASGRGCHIMFDEVMHAHAMSQLQLENDLRQAVEKNELLLHYQPIVSLDTSKIIGFEALLRWKCPSGELVPPVEFIPVAEETGLIIPIGRWVFYEACRQMCLWQKQFPARTPLTISINLSSRQFSPELIGQIKQILRETGLSPNSLRLEITESIIMKDPEAAAALILQLRKMDIKVYIDDFGTGYSSLSYLYKFPIDALKIDRSFIKIMCNDKGVMEIVKSIIALAHNLKKYVIAEGVETPEQLEELRKLKCEYFQGYLFSKPLDSKAAEALLSGNHI